jgi:hypothetical protein
MDRIDVIQCRPQACHNLEQSGGRRALRIVTVAAVALVAAIALSATPVSAQALDAEEVVLQGGPFGGISNFGTGVFPEVGFRLGRKRGAKILDLSISGIQNRPRLMYAVRRWGFEGLVGRAWQPGPLGLGFRFGIIHAPNVLGEYLTHPAFGPHTTLVVQAGSQFSIRSEAGAHFYISRLGPGGPRGYIRVGLEARR